MHNSTLAPYLYVNTGCLSMWPPVRNLLLHTDKSKDTRNIDAGNI